MAPQKPLLKSARVIQEKVAKETTPQVPKISK